MKEYNMKLKNIEKMNQSLEIINGNEFMLINVDEDGLYEDRLIEKFSSTGDNGDVCRTLLLKNRWMITYTFEKKLMVFKLKIIQFTSGNVYCYESNISSFDKFYQEKSLVEQPIGLYMIFNYKNFRLEYDSESDELYIIISIKAMRLQQGATEYITKETEFPIKMNKNRSINIKR